jgi:hypothetical protein
MCRPPCGAPSLATDAPPHHLAAPARTCKATCAKRYEISQLPWTLGNGVSCSALRLVIVVNVLLKGSSDRLASLPRSAFCHLCFCGAIVQTTEDYMFVVKVDGEEQCNVRVFSRFKLQDTIVILERVSLKQGIRMAKMELVERPHVMVRC